MQVIIRLSFLLLLLIAAGGRAAAQTVPDTSLNTVISDSLADQRRADLATRVEAVPPAPATAVVRTPFQPNPKKAALYSAILPGAGQLYNREYWKVGLIYAGVGVSVYALSFNTREYQRHRKAYVARLTNLYVQDEFTGLWPDPVQTRSNLQTLQDAYKQDLDLTVLLSVIGYTLQVLDALTFAHLKNFDISRDISLHVEPVPAPGGGGGGLGLVMRWR